MSNLKYESVRIDFKTVVFIRANPGKKETTDGSGLRVNFIRDWCTFPEVVSAEKWHVACHEIFGPPSKAVPPDRRLLRILVPLCHKLSPRPYPAKI